MRRFSDWQSQQQEDDQFVQQLNEVVITSQSIKGIVRAMLRHEDRIRAMIGRMSGNNRRVISLIFTALVAVMKELQQQGKL